MSWKKIEDWFAEDAVTITVRIALAIAGFLTVVFLGVRMWSRNYYGWFDDRGEAREMAFWLVLGCAVIVAILCALVGPRILQHDDDPRNDR